MVLLIYFPIKAHWMIDIAFCVSNCAAKQQLYSVEDISNGRQFEGKKFLVLKKQQYLNPFFLISSPLFFYFLSYFLSSVQTKGYIYIKMISAMSRPSDSIFLSGFSSLRWDLGRPSPLPSMVGHGKWPRGKEKGKSIQMLFSMLLI